jgi:hypothetical protein
MQRCRRLPADRRSPGCSDRGESDRDAGPVLTIEIVGGCRIISGVRPGAETPVMALNFVSCDRGQLLLMPPSLTEWLPENHLVWTVLGVVDQMDLGRFREGYRLGAAGRAPYDPAMLASWLCFCTRTRAGTGRRVRSSGRAGRTWRTR